MLPVSSSDGNATNFMDAFFTAVSATCVTGLTVVETGLYWSVFGKCVILLLIQTGGLGFMSVALMFSVVAKRRITPRERLIFAQSINITDLSGIVKFAKLIFYGTLSFELLGAVFLAFRFIPEFGIKDGIFHSVFHSVSAFCNAGFDILGRGNSVSDYASDPLVSLVIAFLVIFGGFGFFVWRDVFMYFKNKSRLSPYSKIVLITSGGLLVSGTLLLFIFEYSNPYFSGFTKPQLFLSSFFQSAITRTAGFFSVNVSMLTSPSKALSMLLMFIGGASGSTAGGIKVVTFAIIIVAMISVLKGKSRFVIFKRNIAMNDVLRAMGIFAVALLIVTISCFFLCLVDPQFSFTQILYEVVSAFGTVGQSLGITANLNTLSKLVLCLLMFFGRVGIITVTYAIMFNQARSENLISYPDTNIFIG